MNHWRIAARRVPRGSAWGVFLLKPTETGHEIEASLELGFAQHKYAQRRARQWRAKWKPIELFWKLQQLRREAVQSLQPEERTDWGPRRK